jgi:hypothetical protein
MSNLSLTYEMKNFVIFKIKALIVDSSLEHLEIIKYLE